MKRFICGAALAAALVVTSVGSAFAAEGLQFGVRGGYNYNLFTITPPGGYSFQSDNGMGGELGLSIKYAVVPDLISVVVEPTFGYRTIGSWSYDRSYLSTEQVWDISDIGNPHFETKLVTVDASQTYGLSEFRVTIPILAQYTYEDKYYGMAGVQVGIPIATTLDYKYEASWPGAKDTLKTESSKTLSEMDWTEWNFKMERASVDVDVVIGAGYMFAPNFGIDIRYTYSFIEPLKYTIQYLGVPIPGLSFPTQIMSAGLNLSFYF